MLSVVACGSPAQPAPPPDEVTGLITTISRGEEGAIESFTVRESDRTFEIRIDAGRDYGFDLEHLEQHRASKWPVRVLLEERNGALYAVEILDA
jgi:hypothetical protein